MSSSYEHNREAWDARVTKGQPHTEPASEKEFRAGLVALAPKGWLDAELQGRNVLCLAAGGGKHSVLFAALGANVTVVDLSPRKLELDRRAAIARRLRVTTVETSMDNLRMFDSGSFELVFHPVSTCYVPDVLSVYREVARVTAPAGLYISQHKQPASLQCDPLSGSGGYLVREEYYRTSSLPDIRGDWQHREAGTVEFLHRLEDLVGGMCRAGFAIEDVIEPRHWDDKAAPGTFGHRSKYLPPFIAIKARRRFDGKSGGSTLRPA